ncbi:MAG: hypothetical protein AAGA09_02680 [Pseudomonadota bacterium]
MLKQLTFVAVLIFCLPSFEATACSPSRQTPQEIIAQSDKIIIASAISSKWRSYQEPHFSKIFIDFFRWIGFGRDASPTEGWTRFTVHRVLKGDPVEDIKIRHNVSGSACGITFNTNDNNLIFVRKHKGRYLTNVFGVKPFLSQEEYETLQELVGVKKSDHIKMYYDYSGAF